MSGLAVAAIGFLSAWLWGWLCSRLGKHRTLAICNLSTVRDPGRDGIHPARAFGF